MVTATKKGIICLLSLLCIISIHQYGLVVDTDTNVDADTGAAPNSKTRRPISIISDNHTDCINGEETFTVTGGTYSGMKKTCKWAGQRVKPRCDDPVAQQHCPQMCQVCQAEGVKVQVSASSISISKSSSPDDVIEKDHEKVCAIHVGPPKTGSTSLQKFTLVPGLSRDALEKDNYEVPYFFPRPPGKEPPNGEIKNHVYFAFCFRSKRNRKFCYSELARKYMLDPFKSFVKDAGANGSNILLSSEVFVYPDLDTAELASYLVTQQYKIHIVL